MFTFPNPDVVDVVEAQTSDWEDVPTNIDVTPRSAVTGAVEPAKPHVLPVFITEVSKCKGPPKGPPGFPGGIGNLTADPVPAGWGTTAFKLGSRQATGALMGATNREYHSFINTGPGCILSMALSPIRLESQDVGSALLCVAKQTDYSSVFAATGSEARLGSIGVIQIWMVFTNKHAPVLMAQWQCEKGAPAQCQWLAHDSQSNDLTLLTRESNGTIVIREIGYANHNTLYRRKLWTVQPPTNDDAVPLDITSFNGAIVRNPAPPSQSSSTNVPAYSIDLAFGTAQGMLVIITLRRVGRRMRLCQAQMLYTAQSGISDIAWMPGSALAILAVAFENGNAKIIDRRRPQSSSVAEFEYLSRPITKIAWPAYTKTICLAQTEAIVLSTTFQESSKHVPSKLLADMKPGSGTLSPIMQQWGDVLLPSHRRGVLLQVLEHPAIDATTTGDIAGWTFEDGTALIGSVRDLDRKAYGTSMLMTWSLMAQPESFSGVGAARTAGVPLAETELVARTQINIERMFQAGAEAASASGIHILVSPYLGYISFLRQFTSSAAQRPSDAPVGELGPSYILRMPAMASSPPRAEFGGLIACAGAVGLVHIFPSLIRATT